MSKNTSLITSKNKRKEDAETARRRKVRKQDREALERQELMKTWGKS